MYFLDSAHVWHVAKDGNDGNGGHAQQYPVDTSADAKLTIAAAIAAASAGDEIVIWPGTYANEALAPAKELNIFGKSKTKCIITDNAASGLRLQATCTIKNLTCISTDAAGYGVTLGSDHCQLENVHGEGPVGGIDVCGGKGAYLKDSYGKSGGYGIGIGTSGPILIENCTGETTGVRVASSIAAGFGASSICHNAVLVKCRSIADRAIADADKHVAGYYIDGQATLVNCTAKVRRTVGTGVAYGILCQSLTSKCCVTGGGNLDVNAAAGDTVGVMTDNGGICVIQGSSVGVVGETIAESECTAQSAGNEKTQFIDNTFVIQIKGDDYWNGWDVLWLTGNNAGEHEVVLDWDTTDNEFFFTAGFTYDIEVGDTYQLQRYWSYPLKNVDGVICVSFSYYDKEHTSGVITQGGSGWAAAVNAEVDVALNTAIPGSPAADSINERIKTIDELIEASGDGDLSLIRKILKNKAIQNKSTGAITFYDDDGETPILTHTPTDGESTIIRTPS